MKRFALLVVALAACSEQKPEQEQEPEPFPPWQMTKRSPKEVKVTPPTIADLRDMESNRCTEGRRKRFYVFDGDKLTQDLPSAEALALPGSVVIKTGRHAGERALPLAAVVGEAKTLEVWPCKGPVRRFDAAELKRAPGRYLLVAARKGFLKLIDAETGNARPLLKNLAALRRPD